MGHGITPVVVGEAAPTPAIAYAVIQTKADGAINFTASHNPPEYNGIKFSTPDGCPALPEVTKKIEAEIAAGGNQREKARRSTLSGQRAPVKKKMDPTPAYLKRLGELVGLGGIYRAIFRVSCDRIGGAA